MAQTNINIRSETNMNVLKKSIKQLEEGKGVEHELIEA